VFFVRGPVTTSGGTLWPSSMALSRDSLLWQNLLCQCVVAFSVKCGECFS